jgi:hypothetical protein
MLEPQDHAEDGSLKPPTLPFDTKVHYLIPVPDSEPEHASLLQGFARSLCFNPYLIRIASLLPSDVLDPWYSRGSFLSRRLLGTNPVNWHGQAPATLMSIPTPREHPFVVVLVGQGHDPSPYLKWAETSDVTPVIVAEKGAHLTLEEVSLETLKPLFVTTCQRLRKWFDAKDIDLVSEAIAAWVEPERIPLPYRLEHHGSIDPNLGALHAAGFEIELSGAFSKPGADTAPYVDQIVKTTRAVLNVRDKISVDGLVQLFPRSPAINLYAAGMYPETFRKSLATGLSGRERKHFSSTIDILRRQTGYGFVATTDAQKEVLFGSHFLAGDAEKKGPRPHPLFLVRQRELALATEVVTSLSVSDLSATIRMPNDVNRSDGAVRQFAQQYRSNDNRAARRLDGFREVQKRLAQAVPPELIELIEDTTDDIRIISNSHLEWIDIRGVPLSLRRNCSRIPVTPGNLFVGQMTAQPIIRLLPSHFKEILVISALKDDDPIRRMFDIAFESFSKRWSDAVSIRTVRVANEEDLIKALNDFQGPLVVFDGHGSHRPDEPGKLHLQDVECDVWQLRKKVRPPPIVLLSSCDTHAADRNHATTANGFLSLGTRAVIASVFPLHAMDASTFAARLVYRIASYVPAAVKAFDRALNWTEIVSGMIRMQLCTDLLRRLLVRNLITEADYQEVGTNANLSINGVLDDPFEDSLLSLKERGVDPRIVDHEFALAIANSSAISYLNVGRPETILLDTEDRLRKDVQRARERSRRA